MKSKRRSDFAAIAARREKYDAAKDGFGSPDEWRGTFYQRMGWEKAARVIREGSMTPRQILGLSLHCTWEEVKSAYRKMAMNFHPDRAVANGMTVESATSQFQSIQAAFEVLEHEFGR